MQLLLVALCVSLFFSIIYLVYYKNYHEKIKNKYDMNKLKKFFLLYIFPCISLVLSLIVIIFFVHIDTIFGLLFCLISLFFAWGISMFYGDYYKFWGLAVVIISFILFAYIFSIDLTDSVETTQKENIILYQAVENSTKEDILIGFSNLQSTDSSNIKLYAFMQYTKNDKYDIPFLLENVDYEIENNENSKIEITIKNIAIHNTYSYFGFIEPKYKKEYEYKVYINEDYIHINK